MKLTRNAKLVIGVLLFFETNPKRVGIMPSTAPAYGSLQKKYFTSVWQPAKETSYQRMAACKRNILPAYVVRQPAKEIFYQRMAACKRNILPAYGSLQKKYFISVRQPANEIFYQRMAACKRNILPWLAIYLTCFIFLLFFCFFICFILFLCIFQHG